ncbi:hypothetical protein Cgig2_016635 [Carnegiea gigantea]|uniref:Uncharacterized protein n=1 Tax=Carnegiea gigantea TaxID=171969 RepID=A0A9Q1QS22_9CARY|nr:hypothetical protein Cgig2_016635 [Carnegiea gigantea]
MEAAGEDLGLLSKIRPPCLEDAGLEDCALPLDSIQEAFLKAAAEVGSRAASIFIAEERGCVNDPSTEKSRPLDALVGIAPEGSVPGPCATEKGGALGGNVESGSDVKGARNEGEMEKKDEVVVVGGGNGGDGGEDCVDAMRGLKIKEKAEEREDEDGEGDEKPTLVEGKKE